MSHVTISATKLRCVSKDLLSQQNALVMTQHSLLIVCRQLPPAFGGSEAAAEGGRQLTAHNEKRVLTPT